MPPKAGAPLHATAVALYGYYGVLLLGASGYGKSDLALRLIDRGHTLISDDQVQLVAEENGLHMQPPASIQGKLEMRGLGIVDVPFGTCVPLSLAFQLHTSPEQVERMPEPAFWQHQGLSVPLYPLYALAASAPLMVERAAQHHGAQPR